MVNVLKVLAVQLSLHGHDQRRMMLQFCTSCFFIDAIFYQLLGQALGHNGDLFQSREYGDCIFN